MVILRGAVKPVAWQPTGVFLSFAGQEVSKKFARKSVPKS